MQRSRERVGEEVQLERLAGPGPRPEPGPGLLSILRAMGAAEGFEQRSEGIALSSLFVQKMDRSGSGVEAAGGSRRPSKAPSKGFPWWSGG